MRMHSEHIKAAIIGYWRSGATKEEMAELTGVPYFIVERIIIEQQSKDTTQQEEENIQINKYKNS